MLKQLLFCFLFPMLLGATELTPWLERDLELQPRVTWLHQKFSKIYTPHRTFRRSANDSFYTLSMEVTGLDYGVEVEVSVAHTQHQRNDCDNFRLTGRYRWLNDILGDPVTLTTGVTYIQAFRHSLYDISSFHHGKTECEAHVVIGKEYSTLSTWNSHWWAVFALGLGDHGSPWLRGEAAWEKNWCDQQRVRVFMHALCGCGGNNIHHIDHFHGYGAIRHRSIDLGARYSYRFCFDGVLSLEYARRVYAQNFPSQANLVLLSFLYPFGL